MNLNCIEMNGGRVTGVMPWRLEVPRIQEGYVDAQIDDYHGLVRRKYMWYPGTKLTITAKFSDVASELRGTAGFGFWNAPFGDPTVPFPAFPRAVWFFFASEPSDLPLALSGPGRGWFASTIGVGKKRGMTLVLLSPILLLLNQIPAIRLHLWPMLRRISAISFMPVNIPMNQWHQYSLDWRDDGCEFRVDDQLIGQTRFSPSGPLGFVCWMDNQYMVAKPTGRLRMGNMELEAPQWLEVDQLTFEPLQ